MTTSKNAFNWQMNILIYTQKKNSPTYLKVNIYYEIKAKSLYALKKYDEAIPFL